MAGGRLEERWALGVEGVPPSGCSCHCLSDSEGGVLLSVAMTCWVSWWSYLADRPCLGDGGLGRGGEGVGAPTPTAAGCG